MPVVRQEDPSREQKALLFAPRANHAGQARKFRFAKGRPRARGPAGDPSTELRVILGDSKDDIETIRKHQAPQAGHEADDNPSSRDSSPRVSEKRNSALPSSAGTTSWTNPTFRMRYGAPKLFWRRQLTPNLAPRPLVTPLAVFAWMDNQQRNSVR